MTQHLPVHLPFSPDEYEKRRENVRSLMRSQGIDLLYVTQPANLLYLTGYEAIWYPNRLPVGALLDSSRREVVVLDWNRHAGYVNSAVLCDETVFFPYGGSTPLVRELCASRGWLGRTIAFEWSSPNPSGPIISELAQALSGSGMKVVSGDWLVDNVRLYKSEAEVACIREAAAIADRAMRRLWESLRPGMSELVISARLTELLVEEGSELAASPVLVNSGPQAWRDVHSFPSSRRIESGDVVSIDCCAVVKRYHANLGRSFVIGLSRTRARAMVRDGAGSLDVLKAQAVRDADPSTAMRAAEQFVRERVAAENIWWIGGYALGLGLCPSWVGHTYLANDGIEKCRLAVGYVSNFENVFMDTTEGFECGCIDTIVMTENGLESLSTVPRELLDVPV